MKITPLDIKKQQFKKVMRGYDIVEVDTFLEMLSGEFEELVRQQKEMRDRFVETETQLKDYKQIEKTLQQTLLQAQETTGRMYDSVRKESELVMKEADLKAQKIVEQASADLNRLEGQIKQLVAKKESLIGRLRVLLSSELDLLKTLEMGSDDVLTTDATRGTGKPGINLTEVLKSVHDNRSA